MRIAGVLERFGVRVQKSVFECRLEARDLTAVGGAGNVRVYHMCADCYGASQVVGTVAEGVETEPWIVV